MNIGNAIKQVRKKVGMNQYDFACMVGITQTHLSLIEAGKRKPSLVLMERVAEQMFIPLPLLFWLTMDVNDVKRGKEEIFKLLKPSIDTFILEVFDNHNHLK